MKKTNQKIVLAIVIAVAACLFANGQPQPQSPPGTPGANTGSVAGGGHGGGGGGGGYGTGGERGSVIQVISDAAVQTELNLSAEQQEQVSSILRRVKAIEDEFFEGVDRARHERINRLSARSDLQVKKYDDAHQELARAIEKILAQLTPAQRAQLQVFCQQAKADESGFRAKMAPRQGFGFISGDSSNKEYASGGGPGGVVRVISYEGVQNQLGLGNKQRQQIAEILKQVRQFETAFFAEARTRPQERQREDIEQYQQQQRKEESTRQAVIRAGEEIMSLNPHPADTA